MTLDNKMPKPSKARGEKIAKLVREYQLQDEVKVMPTDELVRTLEICLEEVLKRNKEAS
jgi:hypothetical protein